MKGKTPVLLYPGQDEAALRQTLSQAAAGNEVSGEWDRITKDGRQFTVEKRISLVWDRQENALGFLSVSRDITERRRMELTIPQLSVPLLQ